MKDTYVFDNDYFVLLYIQRVENFRAVGKSNYGLFTEFAPLILSFSDIIVRVRDHTRRNNPLYKTVSCKAPVTCTGWFVWRGNYIHRV